MGWKPMQLLMHLRRGISIFLLRDAAHGQDGHATSTQFSKLQQLIGLLTSLPETGKLNI